MGYTTNFEGQFDLNKKLTLDDYVWLKNWNEERHEDLENTMSYYCQWIPTDDGMAIKWDGNEKFYAYVEWLEYLIKEFFAPKGYILNGTVTWEGEEQGDVGKIIVEDNAVSVKKARLVY